MGQDSRSNPSDRLSGTASCGPTLQADDDREQYSENGSDAGRGVARSRGMSGKSSADGGCTQHLAILKHKNRATSARQHRVGCKEVAKSMRIATAC